MTWESEAEFQRAIVDLATLHGWEHYHTHDSRRSNAGLPDLLLWRGPRLIVAELKIDRRRRDGRLDRNKTTAEQRAMLARFEAVGAEAVLWRPVAYDGELWHRVEVADPPIKAEMGWLADPPISEFAFGEIERRLTRRRSDYGDVLVAAAHVPTAVRMVIERRPESEIREFLKYQAVEAARGK